MSLQTPNEIDVIGNINREINSNFTQSEINFLIYIGWKALGWALVFLSVMLILRFLKLWLLHTWELSPNGASSSQRRQLEVARAEAINEIRATRRQRRRERMRQHLMQRRFSEPIPRSAALDLPPNYEDIVVQNKKQQGDEEEDESLPPTYASIYDNSDVNVPIIAESSPQQQLNIPNVELK